MTVMAIRRTAAMPKKTMFLVRSFFASLSAAARHWSEQYS